MQGSWAGVLVCGVDSALTRAGESDAEEHEITPRVALISKSVALDTNLLKVVGAKKSEHRNQHPAVSTDQQGRADRRARHSGREGLNRHAAHRGRQERHVAPLSMLAAKVTMPSTRLWGVAPCGASTSSSWAAAIITGAFTGGVNSLMIKSKLAKIEACTVRAGREA